MRLVTSSLGKRRRSAAVPGRSNRRHGDARWGTNDGLVVHLAAPGDGRTPGELPVAIVAVDISPLIIPARDKFEPTYVGCYGIPNSAWQLVAFRMAGRAGILFLNSFWDGRLGQVALEFQQFETMSQI